tara:strand:+ start:226 stop:438 length:213 start_codon:yes stop_codon:yes gene_type:complete
VDWFGGVSINDEINYLQQPAHPRNHRSPEQALSENAISLSGDIEQLPSQVLFSPHRLLGYQFIKLSRLAG